MFNYNTYICLSYKHKCLYSAMSLHCFRLYRIVHWIVQFHYSESQISMGSLRRKLGHKPLEWIRADRFMWKPWIFAVDWQLMSKSLSSLEIITHPYRCGSPRSSLYGDVVYWMRQTKMHDTVHRPRDLDPMTLLWSYDTASILGSTSTYVTRLLVLAMVDNLVQASWLFKNPSLIDLACSICSQ